MYYILKQLDCNNKLKYQCQVFVIVFLVSRIHEEEKYNQHENSIAQNEINNTKQMAFCIHFSNIWQGCTVMKILPISTLTRILCWETNINHQRILMSDSAMEVVYPKQIFLFIIKVWYMCTGVYIIHMLLICWRIPRVTSRSVWNKEKESRVKYIIWYHWNNDYFY